MKGYKIIILLILIFLFIFYTSCRGRKSDNIDQEFKIAALFPGSIRDADYNTIGYIALQEAANREGIKASYIEKISVDDAAQAIKNYIDLGYSIIWAHGGQFNEVLLKSAKKYTEVTFIMEIDDEQEETPGNIWYIDRNYTAGFFVLGALGGMQTNRGNIGFLGGLELPFAIGQLNAVKQALHMYYPNVELIYSFAGDFNDPAKAGVLAEKLISAGVDVIISTVNLGNFGLNRVIREADRSVYITTTYTDKSMYVSERYMTSDLFSFRAAMNSIVNSIINGISGGFLKLEYGEGKARYTQFPLRNVSKDISIKVKEISDDVASGRIKIDIILDRILE